MTFEVFAKLFRDVSPTCDANQGQRERAAVDRQVFFSVRNLVPDLIEMVKVVFQLSESTDPAKTSQQVCRLRPVFEIDQ